MGIPRMLHAKMLGLYFSFGALPDFSRCHDLAISQKFYTDHILRICLD